MAPFKSSLARSAAKFLGLANQADLSLRGASQSLRYVEPPDPWDDVTLQSTTTVTSSTVSAAGSRSYYLMEFICVGGGAGNGTGGQGGFSVARYQIPTNTDLVFAVGNKGTPGTSTSPNGGSGATADHLRGGNGYSSYPPAPTYGGSGGGGGTGVFVTNSLPGVTQGNALIIAGGGGGDGYSGDARGGNGGGPAGDNGASPGTGGYGGGGTQVGGGAGGVNQPGSPPITATAGTALNGGDGSSAPAPIGPSWAYGGGGGGAGYFGGGGGGGSNSTGGANSGGGGGGSGYINTTSPFYSASQASTNRNYTGMGWPGSYGSGPNPAPLGAGKDHPQISPLGAVGRSAENGVLLVNYYN